MEVNYSRPNCIQENIDGHFKRNSVSDNAVLKYYNRQQRAELAKNIEIVRESLVRHHHQDCTQLF